MGRKKPESESEPVRHSQVKRLKKALDDQNDAILFDADGCPDYGRAKAIVDAVGRNSTEAEWEAAAPGLKRKGGR